MEGSGGNSIYFNESTIVGVDENSSGSFNYKLYNNYPNPFNPSTKIKYTIGEPSNVRILVYDSLGRNVKTLIDKYQSSGNYEITWNGSDDLNRNVSSGIYFYQLSCNSFIETKKMILLE